MLGERLRERVEELLARYVARMRSDPAIPRANRLSRPLLEDHAMSFLGDVFQSIVILERAEDLLDYEQASLLRDGTQIQHLVSELHGRQRYRIGWTSEAMQREYEILDEEVASLVKKYASNASGVGGLDWALDHAKHLLSRSHESSVAGYRAAGREADEHMQQHESFRVNR